MDSVIKLFQKYVRGLLAIEMQPKVWKESKSLPPFLQNTYSFYEGSLLGTPCLIFIAYEEVSPTVLDKHIKYLQSKIKHLPIYACMTISAYNRKRLIELHIPFVIPDNQLYLPDLGLSLREHLRKQRVSINILSPGAQAVILYQLISKEENQWLPSILAKKLGYSAMTMTRALNELESLELGKILRKGRERCLYFSEDKRALWELAKPYLRNPVKSKIWIRQDEKTSIDKRINLKFLAGLSGLSSKSMLSEPSCPTYAISLETAKKLAHLSGIERVESRIEADMEFEVWNYDPQLFAQKDLVDPFSLYLSLQDNEDERVEAALEQLIEQIAW